MFSTSNFIGCAKDNHAPARGGRLEQSKSVGGSPDEPVLPPNARGDVFPLGRGMVGTAQGSESLPRTAMDASRFRPCVQDCGMPASPSARLHHQSKTPNCSQLGVFIWGIPRARGVRRNSTCANPLRYLGRYWPPNLILCLLFSRNFCKPSRCGTRRTPFTAITYACVGYEGFAIDLLRQTMRFVCCRTQRFEKTPQKVVTQRNTASSTALVFAP